MENHTSDYRVEKDSIGTKDVPANVYYGVQSLRAAENFPITGLRMNPELIRSLAYIKKAAALTNLEAGLLNERIANAIVRACDEILAGKLREQFIVDPVQGGAGTSINMNANEVIANRAIELLGGVKGDYSLVNPNDHVNCGQSTNDVIPTAGKMTTLRLLKKLETELDRLRAAFEDKSREFNHVIKMGRTQMQDAVPIRLGQEFRAYADAVRRDTVRMGKAMDEMRSLNMGGTAIGTGINADETYLRRIVPVLSEVSGMELTQAGDLIDSTQNPDPFVAVSGAVKTCAVTLSKIANDLRLMSSGPRTGFGEINLPARQNGSSIMPGKVNPTQAEALTMAATRVMGNDVTISLAASQGNFEMNVYKPVIIATFLESTTLLIGTIQGFTDRLVHGLTVNQDRMKNLVDESLMTVTALSPHIGYHASARIAQLAEQQNLTLRAAALQSGEVTAAQFDKWVDPLAMTNVDRPD